MLQALNRAHILRTLEGARIWTTRLAHAAPHLPHGFILVLFHPFQDTTLDVADLVDAVAEQGRTEHGNVGADH